MSAFARSRPTAPGAAILSLAALFGLAPAHAALAAAPPSPAPGANVLTLFSEPGLKGRHAVYKTASHDLERQGFVARSAAATGMWTLCEGGEVASRCQTVQGEAPRLKLAPQIVRPGLNALALYDQPGLKGESVIYSFAADRPAPFHARSARTWGGPWSLCDVGFRRCQTLDGSRQNLDLVVAAVKPAPDFAVPTQVYETRASKLTPAAALEKASKGHLSAQAKLVHATLAHAKPVHPAIRVHAARALPVHAERKWLFTPVIQRPKAKHGEITRRLPVRDPVFPRHPLHARLIHEVVAPRGHPHAVRRRAYRSVRLAWGGDDPYLYDSGPRDWGPPPGW